MAGHLFADILETPASQGRERTRLLLPALREAGLVCSASRQVSVPCQG